MNSIYLNITDFCNMRCDYCYGNHGQYCRDKDFKHMSFETASQAIDSAKEIYKSIRVVFFGGEPLLNYELIQHIVLKYADQVQFCIVTNGLLLEEDVIDFFIKHHFAITISFEGNYKAQSFRKDTQGCSTYDRVLNNIEKLDSHDWPYNIRMTLLRNNVDIRDRLYSLENFKNIREIRIQPCSPTGSICDLMEEDIQNLNSNMDNARKSPLFSKCVLYDEGKKATNVCTMGVTGYAIDSDGYVYPCYRFIGMKEYRLNHISNMSSKDLWCIAILQNLKKKRSKYCFADDYFISKTIENYG